MEEDFEVAQVANNNCEVISFNEFKGNKITEPQVDYELEATHFALEKSLELTEDLFDQSIIIGVLNNKLVVGANFDEDAQDSEIIRLMLAGIDSVLGE